MKVWRRWFLVLTAGIITIKCAPEADEKGPKASVEQAVEAGSETPCTGSENAANRPSFTSNAKINGNTASFLTALRGGQGESICQFLTNQKKEVMIIQFAGVLCETCKFEASDIINGISASSKGSKMAHVVVFVDNPDNQNIQDTNVRDFLLSNTQNKALARFEPAKTLFKEYNKYDDGVQFGSSIAINKFGQAYFVNDKTRINEMLEKAEILVPSGS